MTAKPTKVVQTDPRAGYQKQQYEIDQAIKRVLSSGRYILGREVAEFEREFASFIGVQFAIGTGSGTDALAISLRSVGVRQGHTVITVSHTATATVSAIGMAGANVLFVDIDDAYGMSPGRLDDGIARAKVLGLTVGAIIPVHLYGQSVDLAPILALAEHHGIPVVEDCAQAHGAVYRGRKVGSWGRAAAFSFYPTKNLGGLGDGGMIVTNDVQVADLARSLRQYGWRENNVSREPGFCSRLDEIQAAVLRAKLLMLEEGNSKRNAIAALYDEALKTFDISLPIRRMHADHVFHQYVIRCPQRDRLVHDLSKDGICTGVHYPVPVHLQPAYRKGHVIDDALDATVDAAATILSLPIYPELPLYQVDYTVKAIEKSLLGHR